MSGHGVPTDALPAGVDAGPRPRVAVSAHAHPLARGKAAGVAARGPADWVLAADTIVELDGVMLGKPADAGDAACMLGRLAGREHRVATGFALVPPGAGLDAAERLLTRERFRHLDTHGIQRYVA